MIPDPNVANDFTTVGIAVLIIGVFLWAFKKMFNNLMSAKDVVKIIKDLQEESDKKIEKIEKSNRNYTDKKTEATEKKMFSWFGTILEEYQTRCNKFNVEREENLKKIIQESLKKS